MIESVPTEVTYSRDTMEGELSIDNCDFSQELSNQLLDWVNNRLGADYKCIEQLSSGAAYAQLIDFLFPGTIPLKVVKFRASQEYDYIHNLKIVQAALDKLGCDKQIPISELVFKKSRFEDNLKFLHWLKEFFETNYDGHQYNALEAREHIPLGGNEKSDTHNDARDRQLVIAHRICPHGGKHPGHHEDDHDDDDDEEERFSLIDHNWCRKISELIGNRAHLMENFSWLSTVGGGFSSLGERDDKFSMRAATLSLGHQLKIAEKLGDQRLTVMCHMFAALAALQLDDGYFCRDYIMKVILPLMNRLPHRDPILINMLKHIYFRMSCPDRFRLNKIAYKVSDLKVDPK